MKQVEEEANADADADVRERQCSCSGVRRSRGERSAFDLCPVLDRLVINQRDPDLALLLLLDLVELPLLARLALVILVLRPRLERRVQLRDDHAVRTRDESVRGIREELLEARAGNLPAAELDRLGDGLEDAGVADGVVDAGGEAVASPETETETEIAGGGGADVRRG